MFAARKLKSKMTLMKEFIILMALLMATVAMSIDGILPALGFISNEMHLAHENDIQYVVTCLFMGLTIGQIAYGPLSDSFGRKPTLFTGLGIFIIGCLISYFATTLPVLLAGRVIQGLGAAAPRILTIAIVRDKFEGRMMAKTMSLIMGTFILVPAIAPSVGQVALHHFGWRSIFLLFIAIVMISGLWALSRLEETLPKERRNHLDIKTLLGGFKQVISNHKTLGYTIASGLAFSILLTYISTAQQIFQGLYDTGDDFPLYFGALALAIGASFFTNSAIVQKFGMRKITTTAIGVFTLAAILFALYTNFIAAPSLLIFMIFFATALFSLGISFGNLSAMAMEPMGHIAGMASAFIGFASTAVSIGCSSILAHFYDGTLNGMSIGFAILGITNIALILWIEGGLKNALRIEE